MNHLAQHPTEDAVLFCGTQDNGGVRYTGEEAWLYSSGGDGGYPVIHWADPAKILVTYTYGSVYRSEVGGERYSYFDVSVPFEGGEYALLYAPLAGTPYNPGHPEEADRVAFGSVRPWISDNFGLSWYSIPTGTLEGDSLLGVIRSLAFASADRLYAGTIGGEVYRFDRVDGTWVRARLDSQGEEGGLPILGPVTDLAVDPADPDGGSIYIAFGGMGDYRHVWHFDGEVAGAAVRQRKPG
jgi:hypothetical protein